MTCHDVHGSQHDLADYSRHCLSCHKPETAMFPRLNHQAETDCIGCHMPKMETNLIVFDWAAKKVRPKVRTHWIKSYRATEGSQ